MFDFIRSHQRLMQLLLLIFVVPSFVFLGLSGYSFVTADQALVEIGDLTVTKDEFTQAQRNQLQQMQESSQGRFDPVLLDNPAARQAILDQLIDYKLQIAIASKNHFSSSDNTLRKIISTMPEFQADGQFSADRYNDFLASYGLSPRDFESSKRGEIALDRVFGPVSSTAVLPKPVLDSIKKALTEERTIRLKPFKLSDYRDDIQITDADVKTWYDEHQDDLRLPQQVVADYIVLDEAAAMASVPNIEESQLKEYYEQNKSSYVVPGRVDASHILIKLPSSSASDDADEKVLNKAKELAAKLKASPDTFAEVAKKESQDAGTARDGGELGWIQRGSFPLDLEQAVFALNQGEVSDPIKGPDGYHIFIANQVEKEHGESFEQALPEVEQEVHRQLAAEKFADMATNLTALVYDDPTSLEPAAKSLGLEVKQAAGIAREGLLEQYKVGANAASESSDSAILDDVRVRQSLFSSQVLTDKQNSGVIEISPDTMVVVRVSQVIDAHVPDLAMVADKIKENLINEKALAAATAAGEQELADLQQGKVAQADTDAGSDDAEVSANDFTDAIKISRLDTGGLSKAVIDAAFAINSDKQPEYGSVALPDAYAIIAVDAIKAGDTDNPALAGLSLQLSQVWGQSEEQALLQQLRDDMGVKITEAGQKLIQDGDGSSD